MMNAAPYVIGIAGSSGSGKTFFLNCFLPHFSPCEITLISQDDYYIPVDTQTKEENKLYNFDLPTTIDRKAFYMDIEALLDGKAIHKEQYTFNNPSITPKRLIFHPAPILIVEGLFIFYYEEINSLLNKKIFISSDEKVALQRRLQRDRIERGYDKEDVIYKWKNHVMPAYREYLLPYRDQCDLVIDNNSNDPKHIMSQAQLISASLRKELL